MSPITAKATIAVTGVTGFVGQRLLHALLADGNKVRALARGGSSRLPSALANHTDLKVIDASLEDSEGLAALLNGADAVINCAGAVRGRRLPDFASNVGGISLLAKHCRDTAPQARLLHLSTLAARHPTLSAYAATKRAGEAILLELTGELPACMLRPPAVYGPGDKELAGLFNMMRWGLCPVPMVRNLRVGMIHVDDLVDAIRAWLGQPKPATGIYEINDGRSAGYSWDEITKLVSAQTGRPVLRIPVPRLVLTTAAILNDFVSGFTGRAPMLTPGKVRELCHTDWGGDGLAFQQATGWQPKRPLETGIKDLLS